MNDGRNLNRHYCTNIDVTRNLQSCIKECKFMYHIQQGNTLSVIAWLRRRVYMKWLTVIKLMPYFSHFLKYLLNLFNYSDPKIVSGAFIYLSGVLN